MIFPKLKSFIIHTCAQYCGKKFLIQAIYVKYIQLCIGSIVNHQSKSFLYSNNICAICVVKIVYPSDISGKQFPSQAICFKCVQSCIGSIVSTSGEFWRKIPKREENLDLSKYKEKNCVVCQAVLPKKTILCLFTKKKHFFFIVTKYDYKLFVQSHLNSSICWSLNSMSPYFFFSAIVLFLSLFSMEGKSSTYF